MLQLALSAAQKAADFIRPFAGKTAVDFKGSHDNIVTFADKKAQEIIIEYLGQHSSFGFLAEEDENSHQKTEGTFWVIDPIDGTKNFAHGLTPFCISIGLVSNGEPVCGVVLEVTRNEAFTAEKGKGAFLNGEKISVSQRNPLKNALVAVGFHHAGLTSRSQFQQIFGNLEQECRGIRKMGSTAADLAYLACGRMDGFVHSGFLSWDIAAGMLLVQEAGGVLSNFQGNAPKVLHTREIIASNGLIQEALAEIVGFESK